MRFVKFLEEGIAAKLAIAGAEGAATVVGMAVASKLLKAREKNKRKEQQIDDLKDQNRKLHNQMSGKSDKEKEAIRHHIKRNVQRIAQIRRD